jgi:hypothetical protein
MLHAVTQLDRGSLTSLAVFGAYLLLVLVP